MLDTENPATSKENSRISEENIISETDITGLGQGFSKEKAIEVFSYVLIGLFVLMSGLIYFLANNKANVLENKLAIYQDLNIQLNSNDLKSVDEISTRLEKGLKQVSSTLATRSSWTTLFKELQIVTPPDVIFKNFLVTDKDLATKITGEANDFHSLALLIDALNKSPYFANVKLISSSQLLNELSGTTKVSFNIELNVKNSNLVANKEVK